MATKFPANKFRSAKTAKILREFAANPTDSALNAFSQSAIEDISEWVGLENETNKTAKRSWWAAYRVVREGVELFANTFYPDCVEFDSRLQSPNRRLYYSFRENRLNDIIDLARLSHV